MEREATHPETGSILPATGDRRTAELCASAADLVPSLVAQLRGSGIHADAEELAQFGRQGLVEAADRFDPSRGEDFRRFAYFRVRGAMIDGLRKMGNWSRRGYERIQLLRAAQTTSEALNDEVQGAPLAPDVTPDQAAERLRQHMANMVTAMTVGIFVEVASDGRELTARDPAASAEDLLETEQIRSIVRAAVSELPDLEAEIVRRHYLQGERLDEVAREMGFSKSWASRIHTRAMKRLGVRLRSVR